MAEQVRCPEGHVKIWKKGCVPTRKGPKVRYVCYVCGRTFYRPKATTENKAKKNKK